MKLPFSFASLAAGCLLSLATAGTAHAAEFAAPRKKSGDPEQAAKRQAQEAQAIDQRAEGNPEFEAAQKAKGLVFWDGKWRSPSEVAALKEADRIVKTARDVVKARTVVNAKYTVLEVSGDHDAVLVRIVEGESSRRGETGQVAALFGVDTSAVAVGKTYQGTLYWFATKLSDQGPKGPPPLQDYYFDQEDAVDAILAEMWEDGAPWNRADKAAGAAKPQPAKSK